MTDTIRVFAGDCTITTDGDTEERRRGEMVALLKPDDTLLVHDVDGYQPVEWLTRAETAHASIDGDSFTLVAATAGSASIVTPATGFPAIRGQSPGFRSEPVRTATAR
jgi:RecB family endonuclease NucS